MEQWSASCSVPAGAHELACSKTIGKVKTQQGCQGVRVVIVQLKVPSVAGHPVLSLSNRIGGS